MKKSIKLLIIAFLLFIGCKDTKDPEPIIDGGFEPSVVTTEEIEELQEPTILVHFIDSLGFDQLVKKYGVDADTILDDMMRYDYEMSTIADSLEIPVISSNQRALKAKYGDSIFEHIQDTASGFVSYYYFDGTVIMKRHILEMIELLKMK